LVEDGWVISALEQVPYYLEALRLGVTVGELARNEKT